MIALLCLNSLHKFSFDLSLIEREMMMKFLSQCHLCMRIGMPIQMCKNIAICKKKPSGKPDNLVQMVSNKAL